MDLSDLQGYEAVYRTPVRSTYRNFTLYGMSMPSSGGTTLAMILNELETFDMTAYRPVSGEYFHRLIDAQDIAFADRNRYMADADWVPVPSAGLLSKSYSKSRVVQNMKVAAAAGAPLR